MEERFVVPFEQTILVGDVLSKNSQRPNVLVLHGAGQATRERYRVLREFLLKMGFGSVAFDFIGVGETGGNMSSSSLAQRTAQVLAVIENLKLPEPLVLIGASMGTYIALKVSEVKKVSHLILLVPGVFSQEAYTLPFNERFSEVIRKPRSWMDSDAWSILFGHQGNLLIIAADQDKIVPRELTQKIFDSATKTKEKELYFAETSPHGLMKYLEEERPEQLQLVFSKIFNFINST